MYKASGDLTISFLMSPPFKHSLRVLGFGKVGQRVATNARDVGINVSAVADSSGCAWIGPSIVRPVPLFFWLLIDDAL